MQGVPGVAHEAHGVPRAIEIPGNGNSLPMLDVWEQALGTWKRERNQMSFTCTALKLFLPSLVAVLMVSTQLGDP